MPAAALPEPAPDPPPEEPKKPLSNEEAVALMSAEERLSNFQACLTVADCFAAHLKTELLASGNVPVGRVDMMILSAITDFTAELAAAYRIPGYRKQERRRIILPH